MPEDSGGACGSRHSGHHRDTIPAGDGVITPMQIIRKIRSWLNPSMDTEGDLCFYSNLSRRQNITKPYLIISFDCDTPMDVDASREIVPWFKSHGIPAVFAVPGARIEASPSDFSSFAEMGFEFMNHGYLDHAAYDHQKRTYYSITWYHEMQPEEIRQDIISGHRAIVEATGIIPKGFRAPHFGHLDEKDLATIYPTLISLGYTYASTTMPRSGLAHGAVYEVMPGLFEFPLSGTYDDPRVLLDSWQFLAAPDRIYSGKDYVMQFRKLVDCFAGKNRPCILNLYVDPSHILGFPDFFQCIDYALTRDFMITTYSGIFPSICPG